MIILLDKSKHASCCYAEAMIIIVSIFRLFNTLCRQNIAHLMLPIKTKDILAKQYRTHATE